MSREHATETSAVCSSDRKDDRNSPPKRSHKTLLSNPKVGRFAYAHSPTLETVIPLALHCNVVGLFVINLAGLIQHGVILVDVLMVGNAHPEITEGERCPEGRGRHGLLVPNWVRLSERRRGRIESIVSVDHATSGSRD